MLVISNMLHPCCNGESGDCVHFIQVSAARAAVVSPPFPYRHGKFPQAALKIMYAFSSLIRLCSSSVPVTCWAKQDILFHSLHSLGITLVTPLCRSRR